LDRKHRRKQGAAEFNDRVEGHKWELAWPHRPVFNGRRPATRGQLKDHEMTGFRFVRVWGLVVLCFAAGGSVSLRSEDAPHPAGFVCEFNAGTSTSFDAGAFAAKPAAPLAFQLSKIDLEGQSAELATGDAAKSVTVRIIRAISANHYLEVVNEGFLNLTTVYDKQSGSEVYPAVHSRHFGLVGQPVFAQYTGICKAK
jgi:hypothetical protein